MRLSAAVQPFRGVFAWQAAVTLTCALAAGCVAGPHGAASAAFGGLVGIVTGLAFVIAIALSSGRTPGAVVAAALRAEAVKVALTVALLWLVLATYQEVVAVVFIATFAASVVIFSLAAFARVQQVTTS
jgi:ATP synthase protein I